MTAYASTAGSKAAMLVSSGLQTHFEVSSSLVETAFLQSLTTLTDALSVKKKLRGL